MSFYEMKVNFAFNLEIKVPESGGRVERPQNPCCLMFSVKFPQSVMIWAAMSGIASMPRHIDAVIHAKGGPTKY